MDNGEILLKKAETLTKIKDIYDSLTSLELKWDEYRYELKGTESLKAYYELVAKYKDILYKFYVMAVLDWKEINDIYKTYCLVDGVEVATELAQMTTTLLSTIDTSEV